MNVHENRGASDAAPQPIGEVAGPRAFGPRAVDGWLELLTDRSWSVRRQAVRALAELGQPAALALIQLLRTQRDHEARLAAAVDALVSSSADVFDELAVLARDPAPAVVADAAQVLGRRRCTRAVPLLAQLVVHPDDNVAVSAIEALGRIGGPLAIDALLAAVRSGNFFRVFPSLDVLGRCGDPRAIPPLCALANDSLYQLEVARALGRTGESAAVATLAQSLASPSEAVVRVSATALSELFARHLERFGNQQAARAALQRAALDPCSVARLTRCLADANVEERVGIAVLLGAIGGEEASAGLGSLLDSLGPVSHAAALALKQLGSEPDQQVREALHQGDSARRQVLLPIVTRGVFEPELVECLKDEAPAVRALACDALARVGATGAAASLFELLADPNLRVVQAAMGALQSLGSTQTRALALCFARHTLPQVRRRALQILGYFAAPEALPLFLQALGEDDVATREVSLAGLALFEAPEALDAILENARATPDKVRSAAMRALRHCGQSDPRIEPCLLGGLADENGWVRYYACQALGARSAEGAAVRIEGLLKDGAGQVRVAAIEALSHLKTPAAQEALRRSALGEDEDMQRAALIGLGHSKQPDALPLLEAAAKNRAPATRLVALSALTDSAPTQALPALKMAARDPDENVRSAALGFLSSLALPGATAALVELAAAPDDRERVIPLLSHPAEGRVAGLAAALEGADDELAAVLASALARLHSLEADEALMHAMAWGPVTARKAAAASLAALHSPRALAALSRAHETDPDLQVRQICGVLLSH